MCLPKSVTFQCGCYVGTQTNTKNGSVQVNKKKEKQMLHFMPPKQQMGSRPTLLWWCQGAGVCWGLSSLWLAQKTWAPCGCGWCRFQLSCSPTGTNRPPWWGLWGESGEASRRVKTQITDEIKPESLSKYLTFQMSRWDIKRLHYGMRGWSLPARLPLIWLLRDTVASGTPSPPTLLRTRPVTEKPMTRKIGCGRRNKNNTIMPGCDTVHNIKQPRQWQMLKMKCEKHGCNGRFTSSFKLLCSTLKFILEGATSKVIRSPR